MQDQPSSMMALQIGMVSPRCSCPPPGLSSPPRAPNTRILRRRKRRKKAVEFHQDKVWFRILERCRRWMSSRRECTDADQSMAAGLDCEFTPGLSYVMPKLFALQRARN
jgi:hypothetical protein